MQWSTLMRISNIDKHFKFRSFLGLNWYKHKYKVHINAWRDIIYNKMQILLYQEMRYIRPDLPQRSVVCHFARFHIQQQTTLASFYRLWNSRNMLRNRLSLVLNRLYDVLIIRPVEREFPKTRQYKNDQIRG